MQREEGGRKFKSRLEHSFLADIVFIPTSILWEIKPWYFDISNTDFSTDGDVVFNVVYRCFETLARNVSTDHDVIMTGPAVTVIGNKAQ